MNAVFLGVKSRNLFGRNSVKKLRMLGRIPAVIYGKNLDATSLDVSEKDFEHLLHNSVSENVLVDLTIDENDQNDQNEDRKHLAMIQEVTHHPLTGKVLHVDFHKVSPNEAVTLTVPIETFGEAIGVKTSGGTLEHVLFRAKVRALPQDLPPLISIDVSDLEAGHTLCLGEIPLPKGVEILGAKDIPVLTITAPRLKAETITEGEDKDS